MVECIRTMGNEYTPQYNPKAAKAFLYRICLLELSEVQEIQPQELDVKVNEFYEVLKPEERTVLNLMRGMIDGRGDSWTGVGEDMNVSWKEVRSIEASAYKKIRQMRQLTGSTKNRLEHIL